MDTRPNEWFLVGFILGAATTAVAAIAFGILSIGRHETFLNGLREWQTLVAGLLALIAIIWIQRQISQARIQENERRERQHYAARATLPAALADLVDYADEALTALKAVPHATGTSSLIKVQDGWKQPPLPLVPKESVAVLKACIETADFGPRKEMAKLLADLQVANSRLKGLFEDLPVDRKIVTSSNMDQYFADFLELYVRCDRMIRYGRSEQPDIAINIGLGDMTTRAIHSGLEHYPGLTDALVRRYGKAEGEAAS